MSARAECRHWTGMRNERCKASVRYLDVIQPPIGGRGARRLPCFIWEATPRPDSCAAYEPMSPQEEAREKAKLLSLVDDVIHGNICGECSEPLEVSSNEHVTLKVCAEHGVVSRECHRVGDEMP